MLLPVSTLTLLKEEKGSSGTKETAVGGFQRSILRELLMGARSRAEMELTEKVPVLRGSSPAGARPEASGVIC